MQTNTEHEAVLPISSSTPPDFLPDALKCYEGVLRGLQDAKIDFAIAGAFALHKHTGIWRTTKDLDVVIEAKFVPDALKRLGDMGFLKHSLRIRSGLQRRCAETTSLI